MPSVSLQGVYRGVIGVQPIGTPSWVAGVLFAIFALLCLTLALLCAYESVALFKGWAPITAFVRSDVDHHRMIAIAVTAFVCVLIGHFWR